MNVRLFRAIEVSLLYISFASCQAARYEERFMSTSRSTSTSAACVAGVTLGYALTISPWGLPAQATHKRSSHKCLLPPCPKGFQKCMIRIGKERKRQVVLLGKLLVGRNAVFGNPQDHDPAFGKLTHRIAKPAGFLGTPRRIVFRVRIEHHPPAAILGKRMLFSVLILQRKRRPLILSLP